MFLPGIEEFLIGKPDSPAKYKIELPPEKAFGTRDTKLIQLVPLKVFYENKLNPVPGTIFNFDGRLAKVLSVSGGRVRVDFNHPVAGKQVVYDLNIKRKLTDLNEKIKHFLDFLFRKDFKFEVQNKILILEVEKPLAKFAELFKDKFKEIFDLELEVKEVGEAVEKEAEDISGKD